MRRISRGEMLVRMARTVAMRGTCSRAQVGVVIARDGRVLVTGYNGAPAGMTHCDHRCDCSSLGMALSGVHQGHCQSCQPCKISVHAEANAIAYAARWGISIEGAELVTTVSPCLACCQLIVNSGISHVWYVNLHRDTEGMDMLRKAGIRTSATL